MNDTVNISNSGIPDPISPHEIEANIEQYTREGLTPLVLKLSATSQKLKELSSKPVTQSAPLLELNGTGIFRRGTVNMIQGRFGSHKSRLAELLASRMIMRPGCTNNFLGFKTPYQERFAVLFIDTERSVKEELPPVLQRIRKQAGYDPYNDPDGFYYTSLKDLDRKERLNAVREYLSYIRKQTSYHLCIFLDVLTDCARSFNDDSDALNLLDFLGKLTDEHNATVFTVVHENPSGVEAKARGHVGTEATNKASTVLSIGYDRTAEGKETDLIKIQFIKLRSAKRPTPMYLQFDAETASLREADPSLIISPDKADPLDELAEFLSVELKEPKNFSQLVAKSKNAKNTLRKRLEEFMQEEREVYGDEGEAYYLTTGNGPQNSKIYSLKPV
ncbi:AAA family ATPase [Siphonobacter sp. SORGH_AS_0500]|uniref:AAA family ATPase n=1 Tax=Siphonobacter sp. SORGH_AS_0500 TaxID=1864824 RepID=UPI0012FEF8BA|nr:AAA family ATPase [Siphonobacter sp. SORGH_AS_0500]